MSGISTTVDGELGLTIHTVSGGIAAREIVEAIRGFYAGEPTMLVLWDVSEAVVTGDPHDAFASIALRARAFAESREGGKTAIVSSSDSRYSLAETLEMYLGAEDFPYETRVFRNAADAREWLGGRGKKEEQGTTDEER